uniref:Centrosomin N-terminal motif 1 domain-containing protein n=1 Tax=Tetranychus urticae TaxID=32264 RepID=T1KH84_TETUR
MLCNSLVDLSSIHIPDKSNDGATKDESSIKSDGSLPSLREPLKVFSPNTMGKVNGQAMTMKQIDAELNALRRENFDLKLRLYVENQKKGSKKTHFDDDERKDKPSNTIEENFKKILIDKDNQIRNLKSQLNDLDNKMKFEIGILRREKEAYANDLETSENLCRQFMEHLTEVCDFWRKFLLEANSSGDHSLLESISNLLNSSQDILNSSSFIINEKLRDGSSKIINEPSSDKLRNKLKELKRSSEIKGMSSLGLLSDLSQFITKDNASVPVKIDCEIQTDMVASEIKALIQTAVLLAKTGKDLSLQSKILNGPNSRSTQTHSTTFDKAGSVSEVNSEESGIKKSKKCKNSELGKTSSGNQNNNKLDLNCLLNKQVAKSDDLEDNKDVEKSPDASFIAAMKSFTIFKSNLSPITESPRLKEYSPSAIQERQDKGTVNDLTYSLESLKLNNSSGASPCLGKMTPNQVATSERKTVSINERLNTIQKAGGKITLSPLTEKNGTEITIKKASSLKKNQYPHSKGEITPKQAEKHVMLTSQNKLISKMPDNDNDFTTDDEPNDEKESDSVRVYLTFKYYQLLRGHLGQLSVRLNELDSLNKDHFVLEIIDSQEYSTAVEPCLTNMRKTINSCRIICHHFTIVDENSVLAQYERIKAKKENIEKAISQQMKKADKLLKKAKINLRV